MWRPPRNAGVALHPPTHRLKELFSCFQGEAASRGEPAGGAERDPGPLHRGHGGSAAEPLPHVALAGPRVHHQPTTQPHRTLFCFSSTLRPAFPSVPRAAGQSLTQPYLHFREPLNSFHFKTVPLCGSKGYLLTVYHNLQAAVWFIPLWHTDKLDWQDIYLHYLLTLWQCECTIS